MKTKLTSLGIALLCCLSTSQAFSSEDAGSLKTVTGSVTIERNGKSIEAKPGQSVKEGDTVITGDKSYAGIMMSDDTRLTAGPDSKLVINQYAFNTTTYQGRMNTRVNRGSLAVISGKLAKANPDAVSFSTSSMTLGVRGTEFVIEAAGE